MLQGPKDQPHVAAVLFGGQCVLPLAAGLTSSYSCDAGTLSKTRIRGSEEKTLPCFSATAPLSGNSCRGWENSSGKTALGSALDNNGNTLTKVVGSNTTTYAWDFENRLTSVTLPGSSGTVSFKYDPFGHRIQKAFTQSGTTTTTNYLYDSDNLIEEVDPNGNVLARYTQTQDIDEPLAMLRSGTTSYYNADALGSVTSLANGAGTLAQTYTFDSFGTTTASSGALTNPFRFTGREFDSESSLYFMRARYFDPTTGRFISEDPGRFPGGINFYTYVENDPANLVDPFGFCPWQVHSRPLKHAPRVGPIAHYYFYNTQTGQSIGLGPATGVVTGPVPGDWERNEKPGHNEGAVPDWACNCVDKKAKNPGKPPNYCTLNGKPQAGSPAPCVNCMGWVNTVLQDCYNQAYAGQQ
jgi:RHS repeat-associated protein